MSFPFKGPSYEFTPFFCAQGAANGRRFKCADMELNMVECLEAYGVHKGNEMCMKFIEDFGECKMAWMAAQRNSLLRRERWKKMMKGEISARNPLGTQPPDDCYVDGVFSP